MEATTVLPITPERQRIVWDAAMDLFQLRQIRGTGNPFLRGSTSMEEVVVILSQQSNQRFSGLRKKGATDRLHLLMTKVQAKETRSKAASGVSEEFTEADALLTKRRSSSSSKLPSSCSTRSRARRICVLANKESFRKIFCHIIVHGYMGNLQQKTHFRPISTKGLFSQSQRHMKNFR